METLAEVGGNFERRGIKPIFWKLNRAHTKRALQPLKRSTSNSHISSSQDQIHFRVFVVEVIFFCLFILHQCYLWRHCQTAFIAFASCWQLWRLLPGPAVRESRFSTNKVDGVSSRKSDLFCSDSVWVCSDFAPDLLFCSSVPGVRVLREPTVPPQWLAAFCSSALRSPWPPVITRTLPTRLKNS